MSGERKELPPGWATAEIGELCDLNPKHDRELPDDTRVSFVPMAAVDERSGEIVETEERLFGEIRKAYTHFADGDVIWAKITPCMENGKAALAAGLLNGLACGSTEFYVLRPKGAVVPRFLYAYVRQEDFRQRARAKMTSAAGHARVPKGFLLTEEILLPPLPEQRRIVAKIEELQARSRRAREALEAIPDLIEQFRQSVLAAAFRGDLTAEWREARSLPAPKPNTWYVYAILCEDQSIYIGQTEDLQRRWREHRSGEGAQWTRRHKPLYVVHWEELPSRDEAAAREKWLKTGFGRKWLKRELKAGRLRQTGDIEPASELLNRILAERRQRWEAAEIDKLKAKGLAGDKLNAEFAKRRKKYREPTPPDTTNLPHLPEGWCWLRAEDIVEPNTVISYGIVLPGPNQPEGIPYIRGKDIDDNGQVAVEQLWKTTPQIAAKHVRSELREGDVLLCVIRYLRVAVVPPGLDGANLTQGTVRLRPSRHVVGPFLALYLRCPIAQAWMKRQYVGMAMPRINVQHARDVPVPVPSVAEQRRMIEEIKRFLGFARATGEATAEALPGLTRLDQTILAKAFRGELVPQDPNDEPASVLLERIRQEAEKQRNGRHSRNSGGGGSRRKGAQ